MKYKLIDKYEFKFNLFWSWNKYGNNKIVILKFILLKDKIK